MQISVSSRTLHCWLLALIVFIVIFLTMPLLIIYLQDLNYEKPSQPFIASTTDKNANCTEFAYEKNLLLADDHSEYARGFAIFYPLACVARILSTCSKLRTWIWHVHVSVRLRVCACARVRLH